MLVETADIQHRYGGFRSYMMRRLVIMGRHIERLLRGSYRRVDITYRFAVDERPHYIDISTNKVSGSYRIR
jgi:hypothetical protein